LQIAGAQPGGAQVAGAIERMEAGEVGCARELHAILSM
jgi:hypothetical protein